jgi:hypothetical protein
MVKVQDKLIEKSKRDKRELINVYDALFLIVKVWKLVTSDVIFNFWKHCDIVYFKVKQAIEQEINRTFRLFFKKANKYR